MLDNRYKLAGDATLALNRIRQNKASIITESTRTVKTDFSRMIFEEYDEKFFEHKVKLDSIFFKSFFKNLEESHVADVRNILATHFDTIRQIYEHVNIKPRVYGFNIMTSLNDSDKVLEESATRMINDYVNQQYYSLSSEERENKYFNTVKPIASEMIIKEHIEETEAIQFGTKAVVVKDFLEKISFPMTVRNRIEEDMIDEGYGKIFDQDKLRNLWDVFQEQTMNLAKVIAVLV